MVDLPERSLDPQTQRMLKPRVLEELLRQKKAQLFAALDEAQRRKLIGPADGNLAEDLDAMIQRYGEL